MYLTEKFHANKQRLFWSAKKVEVSSWKKVVLELPNDIEEYRLLFEGKYKEAPAVYLRNYVAIDNLELRSCSSKGKLPTHPLLLYALKINRT